MFEYDFVDDIKREIKDTIYSSSSSSSPRSGADAADVPREGLRLLQGRRDTAFDRDPAEMSRDLRQRNLRTGEETAGGHVGPEEGVLRRRGPRRRPEESARSRTLQRDRLRFK